VIRPDGLDVIAWTDAMNFALRDFGVVGRLDSPDDWQNWAAQVVQLPGIAAFDPPWPTRFDDWRAWADQLNLAVPFKE
jgi:hypothetical protein